MPRDSLGINCKPIGIAYGLCRYFLYTLVDCKGIVSIDDEASTVNDCILKESKNQNLIETRQIANLQIVALVVLEHTTTP